jgi:D-alanine-D-alanine ligase
LLLRHNPKQRLFSLREVRSKTENDLIIEEFIDGREIYLSILSSSSPKIFQPREFLATKRRQNEPLIATYRAKWDESYRKRKGIKSRTLKDGPDELYKKLEEIGRSVKDLFSLRGYARLDLRMDPAGDVYFIEANPNPSISKSEEFASSAKASGMDYDNLIELIITTAFEAKEAG